MKLKFKFTEKDTEEPNNWGNFYPKRDSNGFRFTFSPYWYFEPRPMIVTNLTSLLTIAAFCILGLSWWSLLLIPALFFGWGQIFLKLPLDSGKGDDSDYPKYGVMFYSHNDGIPEQLWIYWGDMKSYSFPWALAWYRSSILLKEGCWEHKYKGDRKSFYEDFWKEKQFKETYEYTYNLKSGEVQKVETEIYVDEREWRRKWIMWAPIFNRVNRTIDVHFKQEVGERAGSWEGGTIRCSYTLKKGESPLDCLKRMEKEREFR